MTILTLDWSKEAPAKFAPGMAVRTKSGRIVLVGDDTSTMRLGLLEARFVEWAWLIKPHELETVDQGPYKVYEWSGRLSATGNYYILRCRCCGAMKRKVLC